MVSLAAVDTSIGRLWAVMTEKGVVRLALPTPEEEARFWAWIAQHYPEAKEEERETAAVRNELA